MTTDLNRTPGRALTRLLLCAGVLLAVFAMHGASSDHMLAMPAPGSSSAMMAGHGTGPRLMPARAVSATTGHAVVASPAGSCAMAHATCLATLRDDAQHSAPTAMGSWQQRADADAEPVLLVSAAPRAPPRPSLDRLCISRT